MGVTVIVPVLDEPKLTQRFLDCMVEQEFDALVVLDNGSAQPTRRVLSAARKRDPRVSTERLPALSIYALWNRGYHDAVAAGASSVLVCNNDVVLPPGAVAILEEQLRGRDDLWATYPDYDWPWSQGVKPRGVRYGTGVMREGGLYGPAFLLAADRIPWTPLVTDDAYEWWYGDNHLARQIEEEGGRHARVTGLPVIHDNEGTARHFPDLEAAKHRDRRRWALSQRRRLPTSMHRRRVVPGTRVWSPGGSTRDS